MKWTAEELAEMAAADEEIEAEFDGLTADEYKASSDLDKIARTTKPRRAKARPRGSGRAGYSPQCRHISYERNKEYYLAYQAEYSRKKTEERQAKRLAEARSRFWDNMEIGERLSALRKISGISMEKMEKLTGVSCSTQRRIERGQYRNITRLTKLAEGCGITYDLITAKVTHLTVGDIYDQIKGENKND